MTSADRTTKPAGFLKGKRLILFAGFVAALVAGFYLVPNFPTGPFRLYTDMTDVQKKQTIPFVRLADDNTQLDYTPRFKPTDKSLKKFPGVRDCLVWSQARSTTPDLRLINWNKILTPDDAAICMWWIFLSIEDWKGVESWMDFHKLNPSSYEDNVARVKKAARKRHLRGKPPKGPVGYAIIGRLDMLNNREDKIPYATRGHWRIPHLYVNAQIYSIVWNLEGQVTYFKIRHQIL